MQVRKQKRRGRWFLRFFALVILIAAAVYGYSNLALTKSPYEKKSAKLPKSFDGFKIVAISDLHGKKFGRDNSALIKAIDSENPDIIVLAGDMVTYSGDDINVFYSLARTLSQKYDTYYVQGNHEGQLPDDMKNDLLTIISGYGVHVLDNDRAEIIRDGESIDIYGLTLPGYMYSGTDENGDALYSPTPEWIRDTIGEAPAGDRFSILLAHTPLYFDSYADWGADLVFSGHIHGGEIRLPHFGGVISPHGELFPEYDAGEFEIGDSTMILSRGLGEHSVPFRFLNPADVCVVTLKAETSE